jgi:hypothetical protein
MAHQERRNGCGSSLHRRPDEMMMTSIVGAGAGAGIHLVVFFEGSIRPLLIEVN